MIPYRNLDEDIFKIFAIANDIYTNLQNLAKLLPAEAAASDADHAPSPSHIDTKGTDEPPKEIRADSKASLTKQKDVIIGKIKKLETSITSLNLTNYLNIKTTNFIKSEINKLLDKTRQDLSTCTDTDTDDVTADKEAINNSAYAILHSVFILESLTAAKRDGDTEELRSINVLGEHYNKKDGPLSAFFTALNNHLITADTIDHLSRDSIKASERYGETIQCLSIDGIKAAYQTEGSQITSGCWHGLSAFNPPLLVALKKLDQLDTSKNQIMALLKGETGLCAPAPLQNELKNRLTYTLTKIHSSYSQQPRIQTAIRLKEEVDTPDLIEIHKLATQVKKLESTIEEIASRKDGMKQAISTLFNLREHLENETAIDDINEITSLAFQNAPSTDPIETHFTAAVKEVLEEHWGFYLYPIGKQIAQSLQSTTASTTPFHRWFNLTRDLDNVLPPASTTATAKCSVIQERRNPVINAIVHRREQLSMLLKQTELATYTEAESGLIFEALLHLDAIGQTLALSLNAYQREIIQPAISRRIERTIRGHLPKRQEEEEEQVQRALERLRLHRPTPHRRTDHTPH